MKNKNIFVLFLVLSFCTHSYPQHKEKIMEINDNSSVDKGTYRMCFVRRAPVVEPMDLSPMLHSLLYKLEQEDSTLFSLKGYSPGMQEVAVFHSGENRIDAFLATSKIEWNFGRDKIDPTHEIIFFNNYTGLRNVYFRMSFVAEGEVSDGPGIVMELKLRYDVVAKESLKQGVYIEKLFSLFVTALNPDFGYVELPGHPNSIERPQSFEVGWLTYFSHKERKIEKDIFPPSMMVKINDIGTKIFATPSLSGETYNDIANQINLIHRKLTSKK